MTKAPDFDLLRVEYKALWQAMQIDPANRSLFDSVARRRYANMKRYAAIERATGVPATFIAVIHERESSGDFSKHLHNGDPLNGRTYHVPAGRPKDGSPPFTFEESAKDALELHGLHQIQRWTLERMLYELERYNGWGYRLYHRINSPYLWARTSNYSRGKYVSDGRWDGTVEDRQLGCAGLISALWTIDPTLRVPFEGGGEPGVRRPEAPEISMVPAEPPKVPEWRLPPIEPRIPDAAPTRPRAGFFFRLHAFLTTGVWK